jgi:outer membrane immunogenic protein
MPNMRKLIAAGVVVSGMMLSPASAAGPQAKSQPVPIYGWTGWYGGVNAGYGWQDRSAAFSGDYFDDPITGLGGGAGTVFTDSLAISSGQASEEAAVNHPAYRQSPRASGFTGGGQIGYNWQIERSWVAGFEADLQYANIKGDALFRAPDGGGVTLSAASSHQLDWYGTLRGRIGYLLSDRLLAFGTGGLAYGGTKAQAAIAIIGPLGWDVSAGLATQIICPGFTTCLAGSSSQTSVGWTAGGGFEYAVLPNVTIKAEYLHIDLGHQNVQLTVQSPATGNGFVNVRFSNAYDIVHMGVNFRF